MTVSASHYVNVSNPAGLPGRQPADHRRQLAARLLAARRASTGPAAPAPAAVARGAASYPCSPQQRRFWLASQIDDDQTRLGNVRTAFRLRGPLDVAVLAEALAAVVDRHEILRTVITVPDPASLEPRQQLLTDPAARLELVDLTGLPEADREPRAHVLTRQAIGERFDLATGPLLRLTLFRLAPDDHVVLLVCDHIALDEPSTTAVLDDLARHYAARLAAQPDPPPPRLQYVDYAVWAVGRLTPAEQERRQAWWRQWLAPPRAQLSLPFRQPGPEPANPAGETGQYAPVTLPAGVLDRLCRAGAGGEQPATPFVALLTVFKLLLARYSGQSDLTIGTIAAGRELPDWEPVVGCFLDLLPLRTDLTGASTLAGALARVRASVAGSLAHQLPFDQVVAAANPHRRRIGEQLLYQASFVLMQPRMSHRAKMTYGDWPGLRISEWDHGTDPDGVDLVVEAIPAPNGEVWLNFRSRAGAAEPDAIRQLAYQYLTLATSLAAAPDSPLEQVTISPPAEQAELGMLSRGPELPVPPDGVLAQIRRQARITPEAPAVVADGQTRSYRELMAEVDGLAQRLARAGAGPGARVAICLDRSAGLVVAPLAVWATGAAWVPVDPEYPPDRQAFVVSDADAAVLLTRRGIAGQLPASDAPVVVLDDPAADPPATAPPADPARPAGPADLAYVLYTSGSTGRPKGVAVSHHNLVNFLQAMGRLLGTRPEHRWLAVTSLAFDIAGLELWLPLLTGARVVVASDRATRDGETLADLVATHGVDHIQTTPYTWRLLLAGGLVHRPGLVGLIGGEALPVPLARQLSTVTDRLINVYGPTETTIWSTSWEVPDQPVRASIGTPLDNTQVYVLDSAGRPAPRGVPGELYIGGDGVTLGYLGRPGLTAARFVPDPYGGRPGARLYRTGDRVRWCGDGTMEFLGRIDNQVKVRGYRIEPGEIEARLLTHPAVAQAAVVVRPDAAGEPSLVGYYVPVDGAQPNLAELRDHLTQGLPAYMVPPHLLALEALPLTPNGKLDRASLPAPAAAGPRPHAPPPRSEAEQLVADVWSQVLGVDQVGATDDFFDLGGHSLLALQVTIALREAVGLAIPVRLCFQHPTVAELAAALEAEIRAELAQLPAAQADQILTGEGHR